MRVSGFFFYIPSPTVGVFCMIYITDLVDLSQWKDENYICLCLSLLWRISTTSLTVYTALGIPTRRQKIRII